MGGRTWNTGPGTWVAGPGIPALLVVLRWNSFSVPLTQDEAEYAYAAQILQRSLHPYEDAPVNNFF